MHNFLLREAENLPSGKRPAWIPKVTEYLQGMGEKDIPSISSLVLNVSTLQGVKNEGNIPPSLIATAGKREPKHRMLPENLIRRWKWDEGMSSKSIAVRLKRECGITVSYKTIQRFFK